MCDEYCLKMELPIPPKIRSRHGRVHNLKCLQEDLTTLTDLKESHKCKLLVLDTDSADAEYPISSNKHLVSNKYHTNDT